MSKPSAIILCAGPQNVDYVYGAEQRQRLGELTTLATPEVITAEALTAAGDRFSDVRAVFSTWGMWALSDVERAALPALEIVFYAAGSVKAFAPPLLANGIRVVTARTANAVPVAEFTLAQILLSLKGYFRNTRAFTEPRPAPSPFRGRGAYGATVALIGGGAVARELIELLRPFRLRTVLNDPTLDDAEFTRLGVERVSLDAAFAEADIVSNHLPNLESLRGVLNAPLFDSLRPDATFINTGRGAQVAEDDLIAMLQRRADVTALLDVTWPEPPASGSPLYTLPNVQLSTHIAGSMNDEVHRMSDLVLDECERWLAGERLQYEVTAADLATMA
jgi:phosphoglycerate dehydrogenase-like enzyme